MHNWLCTGVRIVGKVWVLGANMEDDGGIQWWQQQGQEQQQEEENE